MSNDSPPPAKHCGGRTMQFRMIRELQKNCDAYLAEHEPEEDTYLWMRFPSSSARLWHLLEVLDLLSRRVVKIQR
jgi:hypothetical protein